jgi:predicted porin
MRKSGRALWIHTLTILLTATLAYSQSDPAGATPPLLTCESQPGGREYCSADTSSGVALATQTSSESCLLGKTWGYDDKGVWVADGCGAQFTMGRTEGASSEQGDGFLRKFEPYGRFQGHVAVFDDEAEIQDNVSWLGLKFETGNRFKLFARFELGTNLIGNVDRFRAGARTDSGMLTLEQLENPDVFGARLGYLGVDFGAAGSVTLGKDWGMHYSIAGYTTDRWNAFGGQASMAYPGYGDGGISGTGRADQVINYRVTVAKIVELGAQAQFANSQNDEFVDGYGASVQVTVLPGLKLGGAYTQTEISGLTEGEILGLAGDAEYVILGAKYSSDLLDVGAVWADQKNGDARYIFEPGVQDPDQIPVVFDGTGIEIYLRVKFGKWGLIGGYIDYDPDTDGTLLDPDFRTKYFIIGGEWQITDGTGVYTEFRIDDSVGPEGEGSTSVGVLGLKYRFSWNSSHRP